LINPAQHYRFTETFFLQHGCVYLRFRLNIANDILDNLLLTKSFDKHFMFIFYRLFFALHFHSKLCALKKIFSQIDTLQVAEKSSIKFICPNGKIFNDSTSLVNEGSNTTLLRYETGSNTVRISDTTAVIKVNNHQLKAGGMKIGGLNRRLTEKASEY
jgi:hypothetical protein